MESKDVVRRFVDEAVNGGRLEVVDELFTPAMTGWVRDSFGAFRASFPDLEMELVDSSPRARPWSGGSPAPPPTAGNGAAIHRPAVASRTVDEVYIFRFSGDRIAGVWGIEDTVDRFQQLGLDPS